MVFAAARPQNTRLPFRLTGTFDMTRCLGEFVDTDCFSNALAGVAIHEKVDRRAVLSRFANCLQQRSCRNTYSNKLELGQGCGNIEKLTGYLCPDVVVGCFAIR